jgi:hypothetical protein
MLDQNLISIGKLKTAYRLNAHDADVHLAAFSRMNCLDVYALWHEAVRFVAVEENNKKSISDEVVDPYFPDTSDMGQGPLEGRILAKRLLRHFLYSARSGTPRERLQRIFDRVLHFTYDDPDAQQILSANRILDLLYEQRLFGFPGKGKVDIAAGEYTSPELFAVFCEFFDDAISVNKEAAVRHMDASGYPLVQEVKGLSFVLAKRILATPITQISSTTLPPVMQEPVIDEHYQGGSAEDAPKSPPEPIIIPRSLWQGKEYAAVVKAMREREDKDFVIAHVLFNFCKLENKIEIDVLLRGHKERILDDSTYTKKTNKLLNEAAAYHIISP